MTNEFYNEIIAAVVEDIENIDIENYWQHETTFWSDIDGKLYRVVYDVLSAEKVEDEETNYWERSYCVQVTAVLTWDNQRQEHIRIEFERERLLIEGEC